MSKKNWGKITNINKYRKAKKLEEEKNIRLNKQQKSVSNWFHLDKGKKNSRYEKQFRHNANMFDKSNNEFNEFYHNRLNKKEQEEFRKHYSSNLKKEFNPNLKFKAIIYDDGGYYTISENAISIEEAKKDALAYKERFPNVRNKVKVLYEPEANYLLDPYFKENKIAYAEFLRNKDKIFSK